jgi:ribosomal-protein-alanine N-acetyltransferase
MRWWDITTVAAIETSAFPTSAWSTETFWTELAGVPESRWYVVAVEDAAVIGYAGLMSVGSQGDVQTIAVAEHARTRGVGRRLLEALLDEAARRGCTQVMLEVAADNQPAQSLYDRMGFRTLAKRPGYYGPGRDARVMRRRLGGDVDE